MAALDTAFELSKLLDCGLDREALSICVALIESGVNPEVGAAAPFHSCQAAALACWAQQRGRQAPCSLAPV